MKTYNFFNDSERVIDSVFEAILPPVDEPPVSSIFEAGPSEGARIGDMGGMQTRSQAMAAVLTWVEDKDFSIDALDAIAQGIADLDGDGDLDDDEMEEFDAMLDAITEAMVALGANSDNVGAFIGDGDDEEGAKLGKFLSEKLDGQDAEDDVLISRFAVGETLIAEAAKRKIIRDGKVVFTRKRTHKIRLSAAQRAALKKARRKANTGAARLARKKSMKIRKRRGL